ncbi:MAG: hypothetical protein KC502_02590 [Myxococcales bacterium]|nr:hypothetical protein [Myxococcales bacterium]
MISRRLRVAIGGTGPKLSARSALIWAGISATIAACGSAPPASRTTLQHRHEADADAAFTMGRYGLAARRYQHSVSMARARDDQPGVARLLLRQGTALAALGKCELALPRLRESAAVFIQLGQPEAARRPQLAVGRCLAETGDKAGAQTALELAQSSSDRCVRAESLAGLGALQAQRGELAAARERYDNAAKMGCKSQGAIALLAYNRGRLAQKQQRPAAARSRYKQAAAAFAQAHDEGGLAASLLALGQLAAANEQRLEAGDLLRRAGHAAWAATRRRQAALAFGLAAEQFSRAGRKADAKRCRALGRAALRQATQSSPATRR